VPAASLPTIRPGLMFLRHNSDLATVQELQQQQEHLVAHRVNRYDARPRSRRHGRVDSGTGWVQPGRRVGPAKEFPKEEAPRCQDASVGVD
jgi:hypothetical protein